MVLSAIILKTVLVTLRARTFHHNNGHFVKSSSRCSLRIAYRSNSVSAGSLLSESSLSAHAGTEPIEYRKEVDRAVVGVGVATGSSACDCALECLYSS